MSEPSDVLPEIQSASGRKPPPPIKAWIQRWDQDAACMPITAFNVGGALLKSQGVVARDLGDGRNLSSYILGSLGLILVATLGYGATMGMAAGATQALFAALKLPLIVLGSAALCLPAFYVFQCLVGARLRLSQALCSVLLMAAAAGMIMLGIMPIVWLFSVSTGAESAQFVMALHVAALGLAVLFGMHYLSRTHRYLIFRQPALRFFEGRVLALWCMMFALVTLQMASYLGPLMHEGPFFEGKRQLFVAALTGR